MIDSPSTHLSDQAQRIHQACPLLPKPTIERGELTLQVPAQDWPQVALTLRDDSHCAFEQLIDLCAVDYLTYGSVEWETETCTTQGFSRAVTPLHREADQVAPCPARFAVVVHLLSMRRRGRLRIKIPAEGDEPPTVPSVSSVWPSALWYEREAYDLFGVVFDGHPDLRRILTDYGFVGHPFRKDFPLVGNVELRYDAAQGRCIYEPCQLEMRVTVPRVIRPAVEQSENQQEVQDG